MQTDIAREHNEASAAYAASIDRTIRRMEIHILYLRQVREAVMRTGDPLDDLGDVDTTDAAGKAAVTGIEDAAGRKALPQVDPDELSPPGTGVSGESPPEPHPDRGAGGGGSGLAMFRTIIPGAGGGGRTTREPPDDDAVSQ